MITLYAVEMVRNRNLRIFFADDSVTAAVITSWSHANVSTTETTRPGAHRYLLAPTGYCKNGLAIGALASHLLESCNQQLFPPTAERF
jgi:hypothetical protein